MPKRASNADVPKSMAIDLVWSLWTEIGVSGLQRRHTDVGLDLEPLIAATAYLSKFDARLRDESLDWCVRNARFISSDRLRNYLKVAGPPMADAFGPYAATMKKERRVSWPGEGQPFQFTPSGRSTAPELLRPALVQLRLRAAFGVSARAEVLRWLLDQPERFAGSLELATKSLYGKDVVADTLELFAEAGLLIATTMTTEGNLRVFRVDPESGLAAGLRLWMRVPQQRGDAAFRVVVKLVDFSLTERQDEAARAVAIQRLLMELQNDLRWLATFPRLGRGVDAVNRDFDNWALGALRHLARREEETRV